MPDKEQAGTANDVTPEEAQSQTAAETATDAVEQEQDRIADLEARLTKSGRASKTQEKELADAKTRLATLEEREAKLLAANKQWEDAFYGGQTPTEEQRRRWAQTKAAQETAKSTTSVNEAALWREIAGEDDPKLRSALKGIADDASRSGRYPDADTIRAFKRSFQTFAVSGDEVEKDKPLAKVTATGTTGGAASTLEKQYEAAKVRKDVDEMFRIKSQIEGAKLRASRA